MTLSELVAILEISENTFIPSKLEDMTIVNEKDFCRFAELSYFKSGSYISDCIHILNELLSIIDSNLCSTQDFALKFERNFDEISLTLTHN